MTSGSRAPEEDEEDIRNPIAGRGYLAWWQWLLLALLVLAVLGTMLFIRHLFASWVSHPNSGQAAMSYDQGLPWTPTVPETPATFHPQPSPPAAPAAAAAPSGALPPLPPAVDPAVKAPLTWANLKNTGPAPAYQQAAAGAAAANGASHPDPLAERLTPTRLGGVEATRESDPERTISAGRYIHCNQLSRINNALPGMVTAVVSEDVWSDGGHVRLIDAGSRVKGTLQQGGMNGIPRVFVLWEQIKGPAPDFVTIEPDSPAADELGAAGLEGVIDRHFWPKLQGVFLASMVSGGTEAAINALGNVFSSRNSFGPSANLYQFQAPGQQISDALTRSLVDIPDTVTRAEGKACTIAVMRDMHFSIYQLRLRGALR